MTAEKRTLCWIGGAVVLLFLVSCVVLYRPVLSWCAVKTIHANSGPGQTVDGHWIRLAGSSARNGHVASIRALVHYESSVRCVTKEYFTAVDKHERAFFEVLDSLPNAHVLRMLGRLDIFMGSLDGTDTFSAGWQDDAKVKPSDVARHLEGRLSSRDSQVRRTAGHLLRYVHQRFNTKRKRAGTGSRQAKQAK